MLDRESCPAKATACVDLTRHLTWLQSAGKITFGPVRAEPGPPGSAHATPRGACHGGSLTIPSHGCVHLTSQNAHYYHDHLPVGAEVVVF